MHTLPLPRTISNGSTRFLLRLLVSLSVPPLVSLLCFGALAAIQDAQKGNWRDLPGYALGVLGYSILLCAVPALLSFVVSETAWRRRPGWRDRRHYLALGGALGLLTGIAFSVILGLSGYFDEDWKTPLPTLLLLGIGLLAGGLTAALAYRWRQEPSA